MHQRSSPQPSIKLKRASRAIALLFCLPIVVGNMFIGNISIAAESHTTEKHQLKVSEVATGLVHPWSIAFISPTDWLVTERSGALRRIVNGELLEAPISGLPKIKSNGQGGLLDVMLHPDFDNNQWVYLSYSGQALIKAGTEVLRAKLVDNALTDVQVIFKANPKVTGGRHFGSRLAFDNQGYLYISLGDRGNKSSAQEQDKHSGTIVRLHDDGRIPKDNPFINDASVLPEIYSYGHRNVQGMAFDKKTNTLWAHEHGPQGGDELNIVIAGKTMAGR